MELSIRNRVDTLHRTFPTAWHRYPHHHHLDTFTAKLLQLRFVSGGTSLEATSCRRQLKMAPAVSDFSFSSRHNPSHAFASPSVADYFLDLRRALRTPSSIWCWRKQKSLRHRADGNFRRRGHHPGDRRLPAAHASLLQLVQRGGAPRSGCDPSRCTGGPSGRNDAFCAKCVE